jgi:trk system potassium uptake protein TrkA
MKVIVCGAGQVGFNIARQLAAENNDVVVVDQSEALVRKVTDTLDVGGVTGYASRPDVLGEAGARDADMLIAVTYSDEVNMVSCQVAHTVFSIPRKIARVRAQAYLEPQWSDMFQRNHMPIDVIISPEVEVARSVLRRLGAPGAFESTPFLDGRVRMIGTRLAGDCPLLHTPLRQLTQLFPDIASKVVGFERNGKLYTPSGDDQLLPDDNVFIIAREDHVGRTLALFGHEEEVARRIIIAGGGNVGLNVAFALEKQERRIKTKLIERNRERAEYVAERLDRTIVLNGDVLDATLLAEANVADAEMIIALTDDDKANLLAGVLAKEEGTGSAMALINNQNLMRLVAPLGLDAFINPRATTVSSILRHVRRGRIRALHSVRDGAAEVIEAQILATSSLAGKPLSSALLPPGVMVGAILSNNEIRVPDGRDVLKDGDSVVIFALKNAVQDVEKLFRGSVDYFQ